MNEVVANIVLPLPVTTIVVVIRMNEFFARIFVIVVPPLPVTITAIIIIKVRGSLIYPFLFILNSIFCGNFCQHILLSSFSFSFFKDFIY